MYLRSEPWWPCPDSRLRLFSWHNHHSCFSTSTSSCLIRPSLIQLKCGELYHSTVLWYWHILFYFRVLSWLIITSGWHNIHVDIPFGKAWWVRSVKWSGRSVLARLSIRLSTTFSPLHLTLTWPWLDPDLTNLTRPSLVKIYPFQNGICCPGKRRTSVWTEN